MLYCTQITSAVIARVVQPLEWSVCSVCVAYARTSMPRVPRGLRRPPWHAWHRLAWASLAGPAPASLPAIMAAPALAMGAAGEASGSTSFDALSAKMNVLVDLYTCEILSHGFSGGYQIPLLNFC